MGNDIVEAPRYTAVLVNSEIGDIMFRRGADAYRNLGLNRSTGDVDNLMPGIEYVPLTTEQADEYERNGMDVQKIGEELFVKIGGVAIRPRRIELVTE